MSNEKNRLVLRRTSVDKGNMFAIRLDPSLSRTDDLYDLFRDGVVIEVLDIEQSPRTGTDGKPKAPFVTLGVNAEEAFKVDRVEKLTSPRVDAEVGKEESISLTSLSGKEIGNLSLQNLEARLTVLRDAEAKLKGQLTRLKVDKSMASDRGYRHSNNDNYHRWIMLIEEVNIVTEQLERTRNALKQANDEKKNRLYEMNHRKNADFKSSFLKVAKENLSEKAFEKLRLAAEKESESIQNADAATA